jgi:hypothetical protein
MTTNYSCHVCGKICKSLKSLRSHMNWHDSKYANACSGNGKLISKTLSKIAKENKKSKEAAYFVSPNHCTQCHGTLPFEKRGNKFCNQSCSATYFNSSRKKPKTIYNKKHGRQRRIIIQCSECKSDFSVIPSGKNRKYCSVGCSNKNKYHPGSNKKHTSIYKGYKMDSGAELAFAKLLDSHNISWIKNSSKFFTFTDSKGILRKYYPDFYLQEYDYWVEIKGKRYIREDDDLRLMSVGDNIELIMSYDIKLPKIVMAD